MKTHHKILPTAIAAMLGALLPMAGAHAASTGLAVTGDSPATTANQLNTGTNTNLSTFVGNPNTTTTITGGASNSSDPSLQLWGTQDSTVTIPLSSPANVGTYISGLGKSGAADVYIGSQTNKSNVQFTDTALTMTSNGSTITLNAQGAMFSNSTGAPAKVTGIANGTSTYDAVNFGQLQQINSALGARIDILSDKIDKTASGIAGVAAMANIPSVGADKNISVGAGFGNFMGKSALAIGASFRIAPTTVGKISASLATNGQNAVGAGVGYSW